MNKLKIIFMGTPDFAAPALKALVEAGHDVVAVYTQKPRKAGRGMGLRKTPIHDLAEHYGFEVLTPENLKAKTAQEKFASFNADIAVIAAYGLILPYKILTSPRLGCINIHASLLPRWRGAAPINRAIMAGDKEAGITMMQMDEGLDTGDMLSQASIAIKADMTAGELHDQLAGLGAEQMIEVLENLVEGKIKPIVQPETGITYAHKIDKAETRIDWTKPAQNVHDFIRGLSPFPGAWFELETNGKSERIKVLRAQLADSAGRPGELLDDDLTIACETSAVKLLQVQRAGKQVQEAEAFLRGVQLPMSIT